MPVSGSFIVVDSAGEEHAFTEDEEHEYYSRFDPETLELSISRNTGEGTGTSPILLQVFYLPRKLIVNYNV